MQICISWKYISIFYTWKFRSTVNENIDPFFNSEKNFKFVFNENTEMFLSKQNFRKNFKSVFYENTDLFCLEKISEKFSNLYLMKIQICFCL